MSHQVKGLIPISPTSPGAGTTHPSPRRRGKFFFRSRVSAASYPGARAENPSRAVFSIRFLAAVWLLLGIGFAPTGASTGNEEIFARIDDLTIGAGEFERIFAGAVRYKYFHGQVPADELAQFRHRVAEDVIDQVLVHREALRLGLEPDRARILQGVEAYDRKYADSADWQAQREAVIPGLVERLEREDLIAQMRARVVALPPPAAAEIEDYYRRHPEQFTEPPRSRVSVILLAVQPGADQAAWDDARQRAAELRRRILAGEAFARLAASHSAHASAAVGGDLGYLHDGRLEDGVQQAIARLQPGELSEPLRVLEGVALFRLTAIRPGQLRAFAEVSQRAAELWRRETESSAWQAFVDGLRAHAVIHVNQRLVTRDD